LAEVGRITAIAIERLHPEGEAGLVLDNQVQPHLIESRALIAAVAPGDVNDLLVRSLVAVRAAINVKAGAIEMSKGRHEAEPLRCGGGKEAVECGDSSGIERI
jgi:hypothetical protein